MNHRRKHPTGKPHLRKNGSDWVYPRVERGRVKQSTASVKRAANEFYYRLKEYYSSVAQW